MAVYPKLTALAVELKDVTVPAALETTWGITFVSVGIDPEAAAARLNPEIKVLVDRGVAGRFWLPIVTIPVPLTIVLSTRNVTEATWTVSKLSSTASVAGLSKGPAASTSAFEIENVSPVKGSPINSTMAVFPLASLSRTLIIPPLEFRTLKISGFVSRLQRVLKLS